MSADNLVQAFPFRKKSGEVVWRVMEVTLSGLPYETCRLMSTQMYEKLFVEYSGPNAAKQAAAAATRVMRQLTICEYGTSVADASQEPFTMEDLRKQAIEGGYKEDDMNELIEADDKFWVGKPLPWWLKIL